MPFEIETTACTIHCETTWMGDDCLISLSGGTTPHIGCTVMAIPRPSLTGQGMSATTSTLNRTGHKDDAVATRVAEQVAARLHCVVVCVCGIHIDNAETADLAAIESACNTIVERICTASKGALYEH